MYAVNVKKLSSIRVSEANRNYLEVMTIPFYDQLQLVRHAVKLIFPSESMPSKSFSKIISAEDLNFSTQDSDNDKANLNQTLDMLLREYNFDKDGDGLVRSSDRGKVQEIYNDLGRDRSERCYRAEIKGQR